MIEKYTLAIDCHPPHADRNMRIEFNWHPSSDEIFNAIRRLRGRAVNDGIPDVVKIKGVALRKTETIEYQCVDLDQVNGETAPLVYRASFIDKVL
jgi:hypothetical protein